MGFIELWMHTIDDNCRACELEEFVLWLLINKRTTLFSTQFPRWYNVM
jgi:hypothetical protein